MVAMLGGVSAVRDPGGGPVRIHDFDLHLDDGRVIAVEVTRCNVEAELQQQAEIDRRDPSFPGLRFNWHLGMASSFDVARIRAEAPRLLAVLEERGIQSVGLRGASSESECPAAVSLRSLGVRLLYRLDEASSAGGTVDIGAGPVVGATAPHVAIGVAEEAAARRGKAAKLAAAAASERHLFVWVESSFDPAARRRGSRQRHRGLRASPRLAVRCSLGMEQLGDADKGTVIVTLLQPCGPPTIRTGGLLGTALLLPAVPPDRPGWRPGDVRLAVGPCWSVSSSSGGSGPG